MSSVLKAAIEKFISELEIMLHPATSQMTEAKAPDLLAASRPRAMKLTADHHDGRKRSTAGGAVAGGVGWLTGAHSAYGNQAILRALNHPNTSQVLQRKCACEGATENCAECAEKKEATLQRRAITHHAANRVPPIVHEVLRSPGQPLDANTRTFMEARFGYDFGGVRIHTDRKATESARRVNALAYTVGENIVFNQDQSAGDLRGQRKLLAHELTHVLQQRHAPQMQTRLTVGAPLDAAEKEADQISETVNREPFLPLEPIRARPAGLQRTVSVSPASAVPTVLGFFNFICPSQFIQSGSNIMPAIGECSTCSTVGCECLCDVATDTTRAYTINELVASVNWQNQTLWDGSTQSVPESTMHPHTVTGPNPVINLADPSSSVEVGWFTPTGTAHWRPHWRSMAHELCGHARLNQQQGGSRGCRPNHNSTIDTENTIAAEHGQPARGHFADPRQGETFQNPVGDRSKVTFPQCNGLHYEAP